jgi:pSer/pThr/pTyr-binding forkhead associated (FHA) protein
MAGEQLRVSEGEELGALLNVDSDLLIGRLATDDQGRLGGDPELSRRHARISRGADRELKIEDLGSANGTFVNGERIDTPRTLEIGDLVRMGKTTLEVTPGVGADILLVIAGKAQGRRLTLRDELVIGRSASGAGGLGDDLELSRRHGRFVRDASGRLTVEDLGSANGTFVNDERIDVPRTLEVGDVVRMGKTALQVARAGRAPAPPAAAAPPAAPLPPPAHAQPPIPAVAAADQEEPAPELSLGSVFAGCRVEEVISHGDMGVVYRAEELALQRPVAIKLIRPEYSGDERFRERFRRESRIAAAIDHPNVIPVFDAGEEDGVLYIIMRLVNGTDLRALIAAQGRLEPLRAARLVAQVGAALDAAHARGMLHRDVKPANVLLARRDHVYLSDFGLAKRAATVGELTRHGTIVARAGYVAPEQILDQRVDARADIYALGCLLFEALIGEAPFARWTQGPQVLAHLNAPRPSVAGLRPDLPVEFDEVVRRAMAIDPGERYPSAGDFGQAALVAAGGLPRSAPWSVVAVGEAAPVPDDRAADAPAEALPAAAAGGAHASRLDMLRWAIAIAGLVIVAAGMVGALHGISTL